MTKTITLKPGESCTFDLETHAGGGYLWRVVSFDEELVEVQIKQHAAAYNIHSDPIGRSLPVSVELKALKAGEASIRLEERRSWEKDSTPLNICRVEVRVEN